jgi:hypothetical protein
VAGSEQDPDDLAWHAFLLTVGGIAAFVASVFLFIL